MKHLSDWNIYLVTDRSLARERSLPELCVSAIKGGISVIQIREKKLDSRTFFQDGLLVRDICRQSGIPLIINDRIDIALALDADGAHLGQSDIPLSVAREILGQDKIIGWSIDHPDQIMTEEANLADYLAIGPIFFTATKNDISEPWGIDGLKLARSMTNKPLVAIGGISEQNIFDVVAAGADSVAVVSAIVSADDVENATRNLTQIIRKSKLDHSRKSH